MARITIQDCLERVPNRFKLIHLAVERVRQLRKGAKPLVECDNKEIVTALREIAAGKVTFENIQELAREAEEFSISDLLEGKAPSEAP
ncbi:MAG: DNA-directed RNA polymerase subunit omega [Thermodesulfatator sp.]|nr:MAG: DNA-directed RNA polymerase subunit omega [Thermodesulfatator sp.]